MSALGKFIDSVFRPPTAVKASANLASNGPSMTTGGSGGSGTGTKALKR